MRTLHLMAVLAAALAVGSCDALTGLFSGDTVRLAIIEWVSSAATQSMVVAAPAADTSTSEGIEAPDTVAVGEAFTVDVMTWESNGCWEMDHTEVENGALEAHIRPYNRFPDRPYEFTCPTTLQEILHTAELVFTERGEALLRVTGRQVTDGDVEGAVTVTREKAIHVR